jgi:hypothetical protein
VVPTCVVFIALVVGVFLCCRRRKKALEEREMETNIAQSAAVGPGQTAMGADWSHGGLGGESYVIPSPYGVIPSPYDSGQQSKPFVPAEYPSPDLRDPLT